MFTAWKLPEPDAAKVRWACWQEEVAPDTGKHHWQGCVAMLKSVTYKSVQTAIGDPTAHIERMMGTLAEAEAYCRKPESAVAGTQTEWGERPAEAGARRSTLEEVSEALQGGASLTTIATEYPGLYMRYGRGIRDYVEVLDREKGRGFRRVVVDVRWGDAGAGKTRWAWEQDPDLFVLSRKGAGTVWWDGYEGQATILLDEFGTNAMPYEMLLQVLDGHPLRLERKGGFTWARWTRVLITSNIPPRLWYVDGVTPALGRRLTTVEQVGNGNAGGVILGPPVTGTPDPPDWLAEFLAE